MNGYITFFLVVGIYAAIAYILHIRGILKKYNISFWGPALMWRTEKGKVLIDKLAKKYRRFFMAYGRISVITCLLFMTLMTLLLLWQATLVMQIDREHAPSPVHMVGIPGVNPLIPVWYGIAALAIAIVVHEFAHGIQARLMDLEIKSLGILWLVVPMGAFVEPDEEKILELPPKPRQRMFAVGPATNIFVAFICVLGFSWGFMGSVDPEQDGMMIIRITVEGDEEFLFPMDLSYADYLDDTPLNGTLLQTFSDNGAALSDKANITQSSKRLWKINDGDLSVGKRKYEIRDNGSALKVYQRRIAPAESIGLEPGMIIVAMDNQTVADYDDFSDLLDTKNAGDPVNITAYDVSAPKEQQTFTRQATLADRYDYTELKDDKGEAYLGVEAVSAEGFAGELAHPYANDDLSPRKMLISTLFFIAMPFRQLSPFPDEITDNYEINGPLSVLPESVFWVMANFLFWLFWLNLMVGLTNALPAAPLDGGYIFQDQLERGLVRLRPKMTEEQREKVIKRCARFLQYLILFLILWQLIGPQIFG